MSVKIKIVSLRMISRKNDISLYKLLRLFKWYKWKYGDNPEYVVWTPEGQARPTEKFIDFLKEMGIKIKEY